MSDRMKQGKRGTARLAQRVDAVAVRYDRAEAILTSLVARAVLGGTLHRPAVRRAIRAQTRVLLNGLNERGIPDAEAIVEQAYQLGIRLAASETLATAGINAQAVALLKSNIKGRLGDATTHVGRRVDDVFRKEGLRLAAENLATESIPNAGDQLQRRLIQQGVAGFTDKNGRTWGLGDYARMAVRTVTAEAVFTATSTVLIANSLDIVDVSSTPNPCPRCQPYDGQTFSLTGRTEGYPILNEVFPIHPNCDHFVTVSPKAFDARRAA